MATSSRPQRGPDVPRRTVATFPRYREAEQAVDLLSDRGFPVERVTIVGTGLRFVEHVAGRVTTGRAALIGALQGAILGLLFGLLLGLFFTVAEAVIGVLVYGLVVGALFGALLAYVSHAAQGGRRDFASVSGMEAERYEVQAGEDVADEAERLLAESPVARA